MKNIIITGANGGIGQEIAKTLIDSENRLLLIYNNHNANLNRIKKQNPEREIELFKCDLKSDAQVKKTIDEIIKQFKKIDVLINCAGVSAFKQIQDVTEKDYDFIFDNNFRSVINITKRVAKNMISNKFGKIVNISSMWGVVGSSMESLYSASKSAINNLTLSLAKELGPSNINVNAICPGLIDTAMNKNLTEETKASIIENTPLNRIGKGEDVANLTKFLISDEASFITGQIITIDGGLTL